MMKHYNRIRYCLLILLLLSFAGARAQSCPPTLVLQNETVNSTENITEEAGSTITVAGQGTYYNVLSGGRLKLKAPDRIVFKPGFKARSGSSVKTYLVPCVPSVLTPNDTLYHLQWSHVNNGTVPNYPGTGTCGEQGFDMNIPEAWLITDGYTANPIVGVMDSGLDTSHPDLDSERILQGLNYTGNSVDNNIYDIVGHGTIVTGMIAAMVNNTIGIAGVSKNCLIKPIKINPAVDWTGRSHIAAAIRGAADSNVKIVNMSWGWNEVTIEDEIRQAISYAIGKGCIFVAASGNDNTSVVDFPAKVVIGVGAANPCHQIKSEANSQNCDKDFRAEDPIYNPVVWGSNYGTGLDIMGPGTLLPAIDKATLDSGYSWSPEYTSFDNGNYLKNAFGTSVATPLVTGVVAMIETVNPLLKMHDVEYLLKSTGTNMSPDYKLANALAAVTTAQQFLPTVMPDVKVKQVSFQRVGSSNTIIATVVVSNANTLFSPSVQLTIYTSENHSFDAAQPINDTQTFSVLSLTSDRTYTVQLTHSQFVDPYRTPFLNAILDKTGTLDETDKANNARSVKLIGDSGTTQDDVQAGRPGVPDTFTTTERISESEETALLLYPNPAQDYVQIDVMATGPARLRISNSVGSLLSEQIIGNGKTTSRINTSAFSPGLYIVELSEASGKTIRKKLQIN